MRKILLSTCALLLLYLGLWASETPDIWYRPDSLISLPQEDSIPWTDEYTVFAVLRSLEADSIENLWSFSENDTIVNAVLTKGLYIPAGLLLSRNPRDFSRWCIYAYHSGIRLDSTKTHTFRLGEQLVTRQDSAGFFIDTLHAKIETEELAYFKGNVSKHILGSFQTYLALKYGITLDYAPYISQTGDTLWYPAQDDNFYHHVLGIGCDTVYDWQSILSYSKEQTVLYIRTDSMAPNEYILLGDNNGDLGWLPEFGGKSVLRREWRMRQSVKQPKRIHLMLRLAGLDEPADSVRLVTTDVDGGNIHTFLPDSIVGDSIGYFTLNGIDTLSHLRFYGVITNPIHRNKNRNQSGLDTSANTDIHFDAESNTIVIDNYPEGQVFVLYLYDPTGKYVSSLSSMSPVDVSMLPSSIFYVEVTANDHIVGAIPLPANMYK